MVLDWKYGQKGFEFIWPLKEILKDLKIEVLVLFSSYNYGVPSFLLNYVGEKTITCAMDIGQKCYAIGIILRRIKTSHIKQHNKNINIIYIFVHVERMQTSTIVTTNQKTSVDVSWCQHILCYKKKLQKISNPLFILHHTRKFLTSQ